MKCPYRNSLVPPCKIDSHPQRENVEYCKVCGEWRYISEIGEEFPNLFWVIITSFIVGMLIIGLLREDEMFRRNYRRDDRGYMGYGITDSPGCVQLVATANAPLA